MICGRRPQDKDATKERRRLEPNDDYETYMQARRACSETPKGLYPAAQGKRSAALGTGATTSPALKGLYKKLCHASTIRYHDETSY